MSDLPITKLTGLQIDYKDKNSTFNPPSMTTAQRDALVNTTANKVNPALKIAEGTQIYNVDAAVQKVQIMQGGKWVNVGFGIAPPNFNVLVFNADEDAPTVSVANQAISFRGTDGQNIQPVINSENNEPVLFEKNALKAIRNSRRHLDRAKKLGTELPTVFGLTGTENIDFSDFGFISVNELQFITLNLGAGSSNQNILLTDDQDDSAPTTYDAIVEVRSNTGGLLLPRLDSATLTNMSNPVAGLIAYDKTLNKQVVYDGSSFVALGSGGSGGIFGPTTTVVNAIPVWGDDRGSSLVNTDVSITNLNNVVKMSGIIHMGISNPNGFFTNLAISNANQDFYSTLVLPQNLPANTQMVLGIETTGGGNGTNPTNPFSINTKWVPVSNLPSVPSTPQILMSNNSAAAWTTGTATGQVLIASRTGSIGWSTGGTGGQFLIRDGSSNIKWASLGGTESRGQVLISNSFGEVVWTTGGTDGQILSTDGDNISWIDNPSSSLGQALNIGDATIVYVGANNLQSSYGAALNMSNVSLSNDTLFCSMPLVFNNNTSSYYVYQDGQNFPGYSNYYNDGIIKQNVSAIVQQSNLFYYLFDIVTNHSIAAFAFDAFSSINLKDVKERGDTVIKEAFNLFQKIDLVKYEYKDKIKDGSGSYYGIIAEELAEIMPELVHDCYSFAPNILQFAKIELNTDKTVAILLFDKEIEGIFKEERIEIILENKPSIYGNITDVIGKSITAKLDKSFDGNIEKVFVRGTLKNCPTIAKDRLAELGLLVSKYHTRAIEDQQQVINDLVKRIEILEQKLAIGA